MKLHNKPISKWAHQKVQCEACQNLQSFVKPLKTHLSIRSLRADTMLSRYVIIIIIDRFYTALFSLLEQTHCARM